MSMPGPVGGPAYGVCRRRVNPEALPWPRAEMAAGPAGGTHSLPTPSAGRGTACAEERAFRGFPAYGASSELARPLPLPGGEVCDHAENARTECTAHRHGDGGGEWPGHCPGSEPAPRRQLHAVLEDPQ